MIEEVRVDLTIISHLDFVGCLHKLCLFFIGDPIFFVIIMDDAQKNQKKKPDSDPLLLFIYRKKN